MPPLISCRVWPMLICAGLFHLIPTSIQGQPLVPADVGTTVNGYQDDFTGTSLAAGWQMLGANVYTVSGGSLRVTTPTGDPNQLLYAVGGYNNSVQEVLARIRVLNFGTGDFPRGGISTCVDPAASPAGGIDLHFRDENAGRHIEFLDDLRAWGTEFQFTWQNNTWYWLRLRHEPNAASQGGANDVFGKIWPADGNTAEPAGWQNVYDYIPGRSARTGFAGLAAGSSGGLSELEIDYVLIKASGLPGITVAPAAFPLTQTPATITNQPVSQIVGELQPVSFTVGVSGNPAPTLQWYQNDNPLGGATHAIYSISAARLADNGARFQVIAANVASNVSYSVPSDVVTLTVHADTNPPVLLSAQALGLVQVQATFSEPITLASATNIANYTITNSNGSVTISDIVLDPSRTNLTLSVSPLTEGLVYTLTVSGIVDPSTAANSIANNSTATFLAVSFAPQDIGNPTPAGGAVTVANGFDVTGGGTDIGGTSDQFQFSSQLRSGDFDVKVRLDSLGLSDAWAEAGLMARETLAAGSRFASVLATPTISGSYFQSRATVNGATALSGAFPVNYPHTWLRLQRLGNQFSGYGSYDGQGWTLLGAVNITMPGNIYFGFAVSSHNPGQTTTAAFRDLSIVTTTTASTLPPAIEPLGQCNRKTSLVISEIMYKLNNSDDGDSVDFVELFNSLGTPEDISGFRIAGNIDYVFPPNTVMPGGSFLVVARSPALLQARYGLTGVLGPWVGMLDSSATVRLRNRSDAILLEVNYDNDPPWPVAGDGAGHSLVLARPSLGEGNPAAWAASDSIGGSPGRLDPVTPEPMRAVVINEFLAHSDAPLRDYIELYNHGNQPLDLFGCTLSDDPVTNKFIIPPGITIPPRGFVVFDESTLNFALSSGGETIFFRNANASVLDAVRFEPQASGVSFGRSPDGAPSLRALVSRTPGTNNAAFLSPDIVINEIMYNPISKDDDDQFVELYNKGANVVNLAGWKISAGIQFTFPANTFLNPDRYLVVARDAVRLMTHYTNLGPGNLVGDFSGRLAGSGERLALTRPFDIVSTNNQGVSATNRIDVVVNEVTYGDGGRWGQWSDGGGSSLELRDPRSDNTLAGSWADSDETAKAPWTIVSTTGALDNGNVAADQLQTLLQGAGECLIDDVEVLNSSAVNVVANSTFETDANGWTAEGTEKTSSLETTGGYNSARSYHVRALERADNQVNRIRTPLNPAPAASTLATIRAKVRWLRGYPEILFRLRGNWLEAIGTMTLPTNLGTPGARNSTAVSNGPPAIYEVAHHPVLPAANQPCVVTARVHDPNGPVTPLLKYRLDTTANYTTATMVDDGTGNDDVAGDGLYSGTISGQAAGAMIAFSIQATDVLGAAATFPNDAPTRECLVRFGELQPAGNFPVYRMWMTQATLSTWNSRSKLDNTPLDVTFVLGNRRVIYNATALYAGSPYIAPGYSGATATRCGYTLSFPTDDPFLGSTDLVLDWPGGHGNENTAMQEQMGYWIADRINLPTSHRYIIRLHVNGVTDTQRNQVFEAVNQPAAEFVRAWMPDDSDGDFYKVDRGFEFNDAGGLVADPQPRLELYTTTGGAKKQARYRWNWSKRATDTPNNHTNIFLLADALNATSPEPYTTHTESLVDTEEWMRIFATEHIIINFDAYGHDIGKNMYAYKPERGKWQLYMFDLDWLMLAAPGYNATYTATSAPLFNSEDPTIVRMYNHPPFRRAYFRALQDAVDGPLLSSNCNPLMDAKYASLVANGIQFCDGQALANPSAVKTWFSQRRTALQGQLATVAASFTVAGTNNFSVSSNLVTLSGTAPITIKTIEINGVPWPITWTTINNWTMRLPVNFGTNVLTALGYDLRGDLVNGASNRVTVTYNGVAPAAPGSVVINEIMYDPVVPDAEYVELLNTSFAFAFDLSDWRFNGIDYTFPKGSWLGPRGLLVLAKNRTAALIAYRTNGVVFGEFAGNLQADGETITLIKPGENNGPDLVVDKVRYESTAPWPGGASGLGSSLQLIDAAQDNARASNWSDGTGWRFFSASGVVTGTRLIMFLENVTGDLYIDDISLVPGTIPGGPGNVMRNGDFEGPLTTNMGGPWIFVGGVSNSVIDTNIKHAGNGSLHMIFTAPGSGGVNIYQDTMPIVPNSTYTVSYWYLPTTNDIRFTTRFNSNFRPNNPVKGVYATPGASNTGTGSLPGFPPIWINEVQAENVNGIPDNLGQRDPWLELYNLSGDALTLDGFFLANNFTNLTQWSFPSGTTINPGEFKVIFADGEPEQSVAGELHTNFRLSAGSGSVALSRFYGGAPQVLDYVNYRSLHPGRSYGSFPDGQPFDRQEFYYVTPRGTNDATAAPLRVFINEWMAGNTRTIADPANASVRYDDWFELYNGGTNEANLAGYYLTDTLTNRFQFQIPPGYIIPGGGYLLVWADNEVNQNSANRIDLHVNFQLNKGGEAIGLFAPNGMQIDAVTFPAQTDDVSQGRYVDGGPNIFSMSIPTPWAPNMLDVIAAPSFSGVSRVGDQLALGWSTIPGRTYRIEYTDDLGAPNWQPLGSDMPASGSSLAVEVTLTAPPQRFFRLVAVQ